MTRTHPILWTGLAVGMLLLRAPPANAQRDIVGQWHGTTGLTFSERMEPIHAVLLRNGSILCLRPPAPNRPDILSAMVITPNYTVLPNLGLGYQTDYIFWNTQHEFLRMSDVPASGGLDYNFYCSAHAQLRDGNVAFFGGQTITPVTEWCVPPPENWVDGLHLVGIFDVSVDWKTESPWTTSTQLPSGSPYAGIDDMFNSAGKKLDRWYPTATTLGLGNVLVTSGRTGDCQSDDADVPALFDPYKAPGSQWTLQPGATWVGEPHPAPAGRMALYPFMFLRDNGHFFFAGTRFLNYENAGPGPRPMESYNLDLGADPPWVQFPTDPAKQPKRRGVTAVTYYRLEGEPAIYHQYVLKAGGGYDPGPPEEFDFFGDQCEFIDLNGDQEWKLTGSLIRKRDKFSLVLLPDGKVLAVGGNVPDATEWDYDHRDNSLYPAVLPAEMYDPGTQSWTQMASLEAGHRRAHHSIALLLPDGRVLSAGGNWYDVLDGNCPNDDCLEPRICVRPDPWLGSIHCVTQDNTGEVYSPPYLYDDQDNWAARPTIDDAPDVIHYGTTFEITVGGGEPTTTDHKGVCLIRLGGTTHQFDFDTRYVPLQFTDIGGGKYKVTPPSTWNIAPRGYYMLFVLKDGAGGKFVPSQAQIVKLDLPSD